MTLGPPSAPSGLPVPHPGDVSTLSVSPGTIPRSHVNPSGSPGTTPGPHVSPVVVTWHHHRTACQPHLGRPALPPVSESATLGVTRHHNWAMRHRSWNHTAPPPGRVSVLPGFPITHPGPHFSVIVVTQCQPRGMSQPHRGHQAPPLGPVSVPSGSPGTTSWPSVNLFRATRQHPLAAYQHPQSRPAMPPGP